MSTHRAVAPARRGTYGAVALVMGLLVVLTMVAAAVAVIAFWSHALRSEKSIGSHGWLAVVPLAIIFGWVLVQLITG